MSEQRTGRRPDLRLTIKAKGVQGAKAVSIAAGWREDGKLRMKFDRDVVSVVLRSGEVMASEVWLDLYENDNDGPPARSQSNGQRGQQRGAPAQTSTFGDEGAFGDDDTPF